MSDDFTLSDDTELSALEPLGNRLLDSGKNNEAIAVFQRLLQHNPHIPSAYCKLARAFYNQGQYQHALQACQTAVQIDPGCSDAHTNAGMVLCELGDFHSAHRALAYALSLDPTSYDARKNLIRVLSVLELDSYSPQVDKELCSCFSEPCLDHQTVAQVTATQLIHKYQLAQLTRRQVLGALLDRLATDPLWLGYLSKCINTHPLLEYVLAALRRELFIATISGPLPAERINLLAAFGLQGFANEYVLGITAAERQLTKELTPSTRVGDLLALAMYAPLMDSAPGKLASFQQDYPLVAELLERTVFEPSREKELLDTIRPLIPDPGAPATIPGKDVQISRQVRAQYEENPYPRWCAPPAPRPVNLRTLIHQLPGYRPAYHPEQPMQVLVAGCGTGFEPIDLARRDPALAITAIDLSNSSLAYGMRMAQRLNVNNVKFFQADILQLGRSSSRFDMVTCTGVLHHMADPAAGWRNLWEVTRPGGVMRISLYSELGRRPIVQARAQIAARELGSSPGDIRDFRTTVFTAGAGSPLSILLESDDFYSLSGCRDLLFHVQEHRFNLLQIASLLAQFELTLLCLEPPNPSVATAFTHMFPGADSLRDLVKWDRFEQAFPATFAGMYQFWCQKKAR